MESRHLGGENGNLLPKDDSRVFGDVATEAVAKDLEAAPEGGVRGRRAAERARDFAIRVGPDIEPRIVAERIGEPRLLRGGRRAACSERAAHAASINPKSAFALILRFFHRMP